MSVAIDASSNIEFLYLTEREISGLSEAVSSGIGGGVGELGASRKVQVGQRVRERSQRREAAVRDIAPARLQPGPQ